MGTHCITMLVIGAGLSRTGTLSTKAALEQLLGPCYHGSTPLVERPDHIPFWVDAMKQGKLDATQVRQELAGYKSGVDLPIAGWYKELMEIFPDAKVLLTVRDPKKWYKSACFIHHILITLSYNKPYSWFVSLAGSPQLCEYVQTLSGGIQSGKGKCPPGINGKMNAALSKGEEEAIEFFKKHVNEVCAHVPAKQLLVFDVQEGWEPLCQFLDVPVPQTQFPNMNNSNEVRLVFNTIKIVAWLAVLGVSLLLFCTVFYCPDYTYLPLGLGLVAFVLWGAGRIMQVAVLRQAGKSKQL